ncbi:MAG: ATP-binding protein [bacterium]
MSNFFKNITDDKENKPFFLGLSTQNKLIIIGSLLSSILIILTAWFVISNIQKKMIESYHNFGLMLAETLAVQGIDIASTPEKQRSTKFKIYTDLVIKNNKDILYIIFRDANGKVLYANKNSENYLTNEQNLSKTIEVSQPIVIETKGVKQVIGSVQLGFTGYSMNIIGKTTRDLIIAIFTITWILSIIAVLVNTLLITRQITLLVEGVKRVSTGEFGYKIFAKDLWGEIKQLFNAFNEMSAKLRQYEEKNIDQLTYERNKLEAVLMSIANGVVVCDNYDKIILVNNASLKMIKTSAKDIINTNILDYYDCNGELCFKEEITRFKNIPLEEIEAKPLQFRIKINNRIINTITSPIFTIYQEYIGYILILHDITKEAEIERMKNTFISNVSHELRTPVTVLRSYIDTLYNYGNEFDEKTKNEFIGVMNQEADRLNKMVNDILDFSRLESPNVELEKASSDIGPIIELTIKSMKVLAEEKNLLFSIIIEPNLPKIMINPESIERVLKNLLSNAIKFSHKGGRVKIRAEIDRTGNYLQVSVEDNGIGINEEHLSKIFDRFYRVENKIHTIKGTGLGLHLIKITIEKHHKGHVFVESKLNEGSSFGFRIPLKSTEAIKII